MIGADGMALNSKLTGATFPSLGLGWVVAAGRGEGCGDSGGVIINIDSHKWLRLVIEVVTKVGLKFNFYGEGF
jgi:hypothetical protein